MIRLAAAVLLAAVISSFLSPNLGFDSASFATLLGFVIAVVVILITLRGARAG